MSGAITQARIQSQYKRTSLTLLSGMEFRKDTWVTIPKGKVQMAKDTLSEILEFREVSEDTPAVVVEPLSEASKQLEARENETLVEAETEEAFNGEEPAASEEHGGYTSTRKPRRSSRKKSDE